jgi:hypothetical protein
MAPVEKIAAPCDPELGCIRLQAPPTPPLPPKQPAVYFGVRLDYFNSSNVFAEVVPISDGLIRPAVSLLIAPQLGPNTYLTASIDGGLVRYSTFPQVNYNEMRIRVGILQRLSPNMFGEIGWSNQQLYVSSQDLPGFSPGTRFLNDHTLRLDVSRRDQLGKRLSLSTFYQLRVNFSDPEVRSRIVNSLTASLNYEVRPNLQAAIDYQFSLTNFTIEPRQDNYHQLTTRLTYTAFRNTQLSMFAGYSFGASTEQRINFDGFIFGASVSINISLF